jgi:hypothetical protein
VLKQATDATLGEDRDRKETLMRVPELGWGAPPMIELLFIAIGGVMFLLVLVLFFVEEPERAIAAEKAHRRATRADAFKHSTGLSGTIAGCIVVPAVMIAGIGAIVLWPLKRGDRGMSSDALLEIWRWTSFAFLVATVVCIVVGLVFGIFRKTRPFAAHVLILGSFVTGGSVWIGSAIITYFLWGLMWLIGGILFMGLGVLPLALVASAMAGRWQIFGILAVMMAVTICFRFLAYAMASSLDR